MFHALCCSQRCSHPVYPGVHRAGKRCASQEVPQQAGLNHNQQIFAMRVVSMVEYNHKNYKVPDSKDARGKVLMTCRKG